MPATRGKGGFCAQHPEAWLEKTGSGWDLPVFCICVATAQGHPRSPKEKDIIYEGEEKQSLIMLDLLCGCQKTTRKLAARGPTGALAPRERIVWP